tara:strand:+ start:2077 stop:2298 length:222 start_codon:yes stop_codon:yes gene_type:complete
MAEPAPLFPRRDPESEREFRLLKMLSALVARAGGEAVITAGELATEGYIYVDIDSGTGSMRLTFAEGPVGEPN